jgi:protein-S-isoprenylcysteine O-methyltransferase Ste14
VTIVGKWFYRRAASNRESKWISASLVSLVLGILVYAAGVIMYQYANHRLLYFNLGENLEFVRHLAEWGQWVESAGIVLVFLGLALYVAGKRRGV